MERLTCILATPSLAAQRGLSQPSQKTQGLCCLTTFIYFLDADLNLIIQNKV